MKTNLFLAAALAFGALGLSNASWAETLVVSPSRAVVLPDDESGNTRIALQFDLSGLESGDGRLISEAFFEWTLSGPSGESVMDFEAYPVNASWTEASAVAGPSALSLSEDPVGFWDTTELSNSRNGAGFIRVDLKECVSAWATGESNHGIVIKSPHLDGLSLGGQLSAARLIVRYGFR